jgi:hypothetical protein
MPREYAYNYARESQLMLCTSITGALANLYSARLFERFCEVVQCASGMWLQDVSQHYLAKYFYIFTFAYI